MDGRVVALSDNGQAVSLADSKVRTSGKRKAGVTAATMVGMVPKLVAKMDVMDEV